MPFFWARRRTLASNLSSADCGISRKEPPLEYCQGGAVGAGLIGPQPQEELSREAVVDEELHLALREVIQVGQQEHLENQGRVIGRRCRPDRRPVGTGRRQRRPTFGSPFVEGYPLLGQGLPRQKFS